MQAAAGAAGAPTFDPEKLRHYKERQGQFEFDLGDDKAGLALGDLSADFTQPAEIYQDSLVRNSLARQALPRKRLTGPIQFVLKLLKDWHLEESEAVSLLGFRSVDATHVADVLEGLDDFRGRDVKDRIAHLFRIHESLDSLFRDLEAENKWLREPHDLLEGKSPLSLLSGGSMEGILLTREYVDAVAGR